MVRYASNTAAWFGALGLISFWFMFLLVGQGVMIEIASSLVLGASAAIAMTWLPAAIRATRDGAAEGEDILAIGMTFLAAAIFAQRAWIIGVRWAGRPEWMVDSWVSSFAAWSIFCGCALILLAPGTTSGDVPRRNWYYVTAAVAVGAMIAGITIGVFLVA